MLFDKPLASIDEQDLQSLIIDQISESKTLDYKQGLPGDTAEDKKEFLADASSFANAVGGYLIFGIREQSGMPLEICGFETDDVDAQKLRLENTLRDGTHGMCNELSSNKGMRTRPPLTQYPSTDREEHRQTNDLNGKSGQPRQPRGKKHHL